MPKHLNKGTERLSKGEGTRGRARPLGAVIVMLGPVKGPFRDIVTQGQHLGWALRLVCNGEV